MPIAVTLNFTLEDDKGKSSKTEIKVPTGFTISDYVEFGQGAAQLIANISDAQVTNCSVSFGVDLSSLGLKAVAAAVSNVAVKMQGIWNTASGLIAKWLVPSPHDTQVATGTDDFDQADVNVAPVITAMEDGIAVTLGTMQFTNGRGDDISAVSTLKQTFLRRSAD